jgi:hypothetical protein
MHFGFQMLDFVPDFVNMKGCFFAPKYAQSNNLRLKKENLDGITKSCVVMPVVTAAYSHILIYKININFTPEELPCNYSGLLPFLE